MKSRAKLILSFNGTWHWIALSQLFAKSNVGISSTKFKADFQDLGIRWSVETNKELFWCEIEKWDIFGTTMDEWNEEKMIFSLLSDGEWRHSGRKWMGSNKQRPGISCRARQNKEDSPARKSGRLESASKVSLVAAVALSAEWASSLIIRLLFFVVVELEAASRGESVRSIWVPIIFFSFAFRSQVKMIQIKRKRKHFHHFTCVVRQVFQPKRRIELNGKLNDVKYVHFLNGRFSL